MSIGIQRYLIDVVTQIAQSTLLVSFLKFDISSVQ